MKKSSSLYNLLILTALLVFSASSCEKIIDVDIPDRDRKIVINGLLIPDSAIRVNLTLSLSVLEPDEFVYLPDANVDLFRGSELLGRMGYDSAGYFHLPGVRALEGAEYRITAISEGLTGAEATTQVPAPVAILALDTTKVLLDYGQELFKMTINFDDPPGRNYYGISAELSYRFGRMEGVELPSGLITQPAYLSHLDPFLNEEGVNYRGGIFFDDRLFDGNNKTIEVGLEEYAFAFSDTVWVTVRLEQIAPSYYFYALSSQAYYSAHSNPFSEPVRVYTNVDGGLGLFSSRSFSERKLLYLGKGYPR
ncbi:MAG: DUF4249 domain-containing protein [Bacteroidales bacterium]